MKRDCVTSVILFMYAAEDIIMALNGNLSTLPVHETMQIGFYFKESSVY